MSILTRRCFPAICALAVSFASCSLPAFGQQPTPLTGANTLGVFRGSGEWIVNVSGTHTYQGGADDDGFSFGLTNDIPVMGNWTGANPAVLQMGVFRGGYWYLDMNNNQMWDGNGQSGDMTVAFGEPGDIPVVGDWNHDGNLHIGVVRHSTDGSNTLWWYVQTGCASGAAVCDYESANTSMFIWGMIGDIPVVGDWDGLAYLDGNGSLRVGVVQSGSGSWYVNMATCQDVIDCNSSTGTYSLPLTLNYTSGSSGTPVVGYWQWSAENSGYMGPGTFNGGPWSVMGGPATSLTNSSTPYATWNYGEGGDIPVLGPWSNPADNLHPAPTADALSISINGNNVGNTGGAPPGPGVTALFTFTFHDAAFGQNEIQWGAVGLVNNSSGTMFCELGWSAPTYQPALFLYPDSGDSYAGGGSASTYNMNVSDPNFCKVSASVVESTSDPTAVTVTLNYTFSANATPGTYAVWALPFDVTGDAPQAWAPLGTWTVGAPLVNSISAASGAPGTSITITGVGFGAAQGTSSVTFNGAAATVESWSATSITVLVPYTPVSGPVVVTVNGYVSVGLAFQLQAVPQSGISGQDNGANVLLWFLGQAIPSCCVGFPDLYSVSDIAIVTNNSGDPAPTVVWFTDTPASLQITPFVSNRNLSALLLALQPSVSHIGPDINVWAMVDGVATPKLPVYIDTPYGVNQTGPTNGGANYCSSRGYALGYGTTIANTIYDLMLVSLTPIDLHETLEHQQYLAAGATWGFPSYNTPWGVQDWTANTFTDYLAACEPVNGPVPHSSAYNPNLAVGILNETQKLWAGTQTIDWVGECVQVDAIQLNTTNATQTNIINPGSTPVAQTSACAKNETIVNTP